MDCSPPGSSSPWDCPGKNSWVRCHPLLQGYRPCPEIKPTSLMSVALAGSFPLAPSEKPIHHCTSIWSECLAQWKQLINISEWMNKWHGKVILFQLMHHIIIAVTYTQSVWPSYFVNFYNNPLKYSYQHHIREAETEVCRSYLPKAQTESEESGNKCLKPVLSDSRALAGNYYTHH